MWFSLTVCADVEDSLASPHGRPNGSGSVDAVNVLPDRRPAEELLYSGNRREQVYVHLSVNISK